MTRDFDRDHVISQGTLRSGAARLDYYTTTPAPSQWVAVGVVSTLPGRPKPRPERRLLVGNGDSEIGSMLDLQSQFLTMAMEIGEEQPDRMERSATQDPTGHADHGSVGSTDDASDQEHQVRGMQAS